MTVRLKEIAEAAGVQPSTVSLVLRRHPKSYTFAAATRERILNLARDLGYQQKRPAPGAMTNRGNIGFILDGNIQDGWANTFFSRFLNGIEEACREKNYNLMISRYQPERLPLQEKCALDGVIVTGYVGAELIEFLQQHHIPGIAIGDDLASPAADFATYAVNAPGMYMQMLRYLTSMNHRKVVLLLDDRERQRQLADEIVAELAAGELKGAVELDIQFNGREYSDIENGHNFLWRLVDIAPGERPTAVFCNERVGVGILGALPKYNLSCPEDISIIVGCDSKVCEVSSPPLSAINMEFDTIGYQTARALILAVEEGATMGKKDSRDDFRTRLVIRDSVKSLPER